MDSHTCLTQSDNMASGTTTVFGEAYCRTALVGLVVKGFQATGLGPLDVNIFADADYAASAFTDICRPSEEAAANHPVAASTVSDETLNLPAQPSIQSLASILSTSVPLSLVTIVQL